MLTLPNGLIVLSIVIFLISLFWLSQREIIVKFSGTLFVLSLIIMADHWLVYLFGIFIIGTIITGNKYLLDLIREWKTTTKKQITEDIKLNDKPLN